MGRTAHLPNLVALPSLCKWQCPRGSPLVGMTGLEGGYFKPPSPGTQGQRGEAMGWNRKRKDQIQHRQDFKAKRFVMGKKRTKKPSPGLMEEAAIQATKAAYKVLSGNLSATSKVMKRSWVTVKSWVKDRKPKAPSSSKRRSLSYARGHGKWLCNFLKSRALEGQAMGTRDVMN
eukprot:scaffold2076_cov271-Pavlova_lutheri.AAC.1